MSDEQARADIPVPWDNSLRVVLGLGLLIYILSCAFGIEVLNRHAGGILPRTTPADGRNHKWRIAAPSLMAKYPERFSTDDIERSRRQSDLRSAVVTYGLLQYVFCPLAIVLGIWQMTARLSQSDRLIGMGLIISGSFGLFLAWTRSYLGSLGW